MPRFIVVGVLAGVFVGIVLQFVFPQLLSSEVVFNILFRQQTGIPMSPQYSEGSVYSVGVLVPTLIGLLGGLVGFIAYKIKHARK